MDIGFLLKKLISMWLMPLPFSCLLILFGLALSFRYLNLGRTIAFVGVLLLMLFSWQPFANKVLYPLENEYPAFNIKQPVDAVVVLGNCHNVREDIPTQAQLCGTGLYRLMEGLRIWQANPEGMLLLSGYAGNESRSYAAVSKDIAMQMGVPADKILTFPHAKDTQQEAELTAPYLKKTKFALVTSASHMPRSMLWFEQQGLKPIPAPAYFAAQNNSQDLKIQTPALLKTERAWYELLGKLWMWIRT